MSRAHILRYFSDILTVWSEANHVGLSAEIWAFFPKYEVAMLLIADVLMAEMAMCFLFQFNTLSRF